MIIIGLCGGSGSGKSLLCRFLAEQDIPTFDCDAAYHVMISRDSAVSRELISVFGEEIRGAEGGINRSRLAEIVFSESNGAALRRLNEITHRHVKERCLAWLAETRAQGAVAAVVDAPLLFEAGFEAFCDLTVAVVAPREMRISRIMARDGIDLAAAERRVASQTADETLAGKVNFVLRNDGDEAGFRRRAEQLLQKIKESNL